VGVAAGQRFLKPVVELIGSDTVSAGETFTMARVEECGDVAVLLAGNAYITGQTIGVNGGMYLGL
jgi:hypothetical protein